MLRCIAQAAFPAVCSSAWPVASRIACNLQLFRGMKEDGVTKRHRQSHEEVGDYLSKLFDLEGMVAFVSGAGGGIGTATCLALAKCGADIFATEINEERTQRCEQLVRQIRNLGRNAATAVCDVRDRVSVDAAFKNCEQHFGRLDILVANAGTLGEMEPPQDIREENWKEVFATNVDGVMHCTRAAYPLMKKTDGGKIVVMSSVAGMTGYGPQAAYCASKGAVVPLAKSLALAWVKDKINVNIVMPGAVNTPFTKRVLDSPDKVAYILNRIPIGRLAEAEDIVGPIVFFSSKASDYCTGSVLVVDGGGTSRAMAQ